MPRSSNRRPKLKEVCARAGVSRATVDRVINNRSGVQNHTRQHVLAVIDELMGKQPNLSPNAETEPLSIDIVIPDQGNAFLADQARELANHARRIGNVALSIHRPRTASEDGLLAVLAKLSDNSRALGIVGVDSHRIREVLREMCGRGVPVVTLASDITNIPRSAYVGIDNYAAGRLAGYLTGRLIKQDTGKAALILGTRAYRGHEEREMGFRGVLREKFARLRIVNELEVHEDAQRAHAATRELLDDHDDLDAIYCIGAGQGGVAGALKETGRGRNVVFIGHGLSSDTRAHLVDGVMDVVIHEDLRAEARSTVDMLVADMRGQARATAPTIPIQPIFSENLPAET